MDNNLNSDVEEFLLNEAENTITDEMIGNRTIIDTVAPATSTGLLTSLLSGMAFMLKNITGKSQWLQRPVISLEAANTRLTSLDSKTKTFETKIQGLEAFQNRPAGFATATQIENAEQIGNKNLPNGYAGLDDDGIVGLEQLPASLEHMDRKNVANGYAGLDSEGIIGFDQLPATLEQTSRKNVANGYAGLDANGKVDTAQLPSLPPLPPASKTEAGVLSLKDIYPVGSIYLSVTATNPSNYFGGEWAAWGSGRVPVGVDTAQTEFNTPQKTGGNKKLQSHTHGTPMITATSATQSANHTHEIPAMSGTTGNNRQVVADNLYAGTGTLGGGIVDYTNKAGGSQYCSINYHNHSFTTPISTTKSNSTSHTHKVTIPESGTGDANQRSTQWGLVTGVGNGDNLQPYITCYMWRRTA